MSICFKLIYLILRKHMMNPMHSCFLWIFLCIMQLKLVNSQLILYRLKPAFHFSCSIMSCKIKGANRQDSLLKVKKWECKINWIERNSYLFFQWTTYNNSNNIINYGTLQQNVFINKWQNATNIMLERCCPKNSEKLIIWNFVAG